MARLTSISGVVVNASGDAVRGMLDSGFFTLVEGEEMPLREQEPELTGPEAQGVAEDDDGFALGAFGNGYEEDLTSLTNARLREIAAERGIDVPAKANKATIISLINGEG